MEAATIRGNVTALCTMVLERADDTLLVFRRSGRWRATWLTACAFFIVAALTVLLPGLATPYRVPTALACAAIGALLALVARHAAQTVTVSLASGTVSGRFGSLPLGDAQGYALVTSTDLEDKPGSRYQIALRVSGGKRIPLLESTCPAKVLRDFRRALGHWPLPVHTGWGLPPEASPWRPSDPCYELPELTAEFRPHPRQSGIGTTLIVSTILTTALLGLLHWLRHRRGEPTTGFSYALPAVTLVVVVTLTSAVISERWQLVTRGGRVETSRRILGLGQRVDSASSRGLAGAWLVRTPGPDRVHVLIDAGAELLAVPAAGEELGLLTRVLERLTSQPLTLRSEASPVSSGDGEPPAAPAPERALP